MRKFLLLLGFLMSISLAQTVKADDVPWRVLVGNDLDKLETYSVSVKEDGTFVSESFPIKNGVGIRLENTEGANPIYFPKTMNTKVKPSTDYTWESNTYNWVMYYAKWDDTDGDIIVSFSYSNSVITNVNFTYKIDDEPTPPVIVDPEKETVATPVISQEGNTITISCATDGASIYYTLDNQSITPPNTLYSTPFEITEDCTVKAIAVKDGWNDSAEASEVVTYIKPEVATWKITAGVDYTAMENSNIAVTENEDGTFVSAPISVKTNDYLRIVRTLGESKSYYPKSKIIIENVGSYESWEEGSTPSTYFSAQWTGKDCNLIIKFSYPGTNNSLSNVSIEYKTEETPVDPEKETVAIPTITLNGNKITITCPTDEANIYYTLNGDTPSSSSTLYSGEFEITETCTVKAIAVKADWNDSEIASADVIYTKPEEPEPGEVVWKIYAGEDLNNNQHEYSVSLNEDGTFTSESFNVLKNHYIRIVRIEDGKEYYYPKPSSFSAIQVDSSTIYGPWTETQTSMIYYSAKWNDNTGDIIVNFSYSDTDKTVSNVTYKYFIGGGSGEEKTVETPEISQDGNFITIACETEGATILYALTDTMDLSDAIYQPYEEAFKIEKNSVVSAYATLTGYNDSEVNSMSVEFTPEEEKPDNSSWQLLVGTYGNMTSYTLTKNEVDGTFISEQFEIENNYSIQFVRTGDDGTYYYPSTTVNFSNETKFGKDLLWAGTTQSYLSHAMRWGGNKGFLTLNFSYNSKDKTITEVSFEFKQLKEPISSNLAINEFDAPNGYYTFEALTDAKILVNHHADFGVEEFYTQVQPTFTHYTKENGEKHNEHVEFNEDFTASELSLHGNEYTVSELTVNAPIAGVFAVNVSHDRLEKTDGNQKITFLPTSVNIPVRVLPSANSTKLYVQGQPVAEIIDNKDNFLVYVPDEKMDDSWHYDVDVKDEDGNVTNSFDQNQVTWDPTKRLKIQFIGEYAAEGSSAATIYINKGGNSTSSVKYAPSVLKVAQTSALDILDNDEWADERSEYTPFSITNTFNNGDTDAKFFIMQNGVASKPVSLEFTNSLEDFERRTGVKGIPTGVESIEAADENVEAVYYDLRGVRVNAESIVPGLYIVVKGSHSEKILVK